MNHLCKKLTCILACLLLIQNFLSAQDKAPAKFGKIAPADFDLSKYKYDSTASAVVIADVGNASFLGNAKGDFTLVFKRYTRIKILNKNGYEAAQREILIYHDGSYGEELGDLKASTFNLENGTLQETKLDDKSVFTDKIDKYYSNKKFTMPAVKEGSIIDISYTVKSDYYRSLRSWDFQGKYPCLWSEYEVIIPQFFHYVFFKQGDQNFFINTTKAVAAYYSVRESGGATQSDQVYSLNGSAIDTRWVMKDVPVLREENFTSTVDNYVSRVDFQLHFIQFTETSERQDIMGTYFLASEKLLKDEDFGKALDYDNSWMDDELKAIIKPDDSKMQKMQKIYRYIRDNYTCSNYRGLYTTKPLKTVFKSKNGNIAEINLLLIAILRHEGIDADPVILGTRDHLHTNDLYPLMNRFNYVICDAKDDGKDILLDASWPKLGFAKLDEECYGGGARAINKEHPLLFNLSPDSLKEAKFTSVLIANNEKGNGLLEGSYSSTLGNVESYELREKISKKSEDEYFKTVKAYNPDFSISNTGIDSLDQLDAPSKIHYDFSFQVPADNDILYFNPMIWDGYKENPFKSADRKYPVEMPYASDEVYALTMDIPKGYTVDELPKSAKVSLNGNEGSFEYLIMKNDDDIQFRSRIKLNKATFDSDDYPALRDFYAYIVKKQSEQIVFKKKK